jgi:hypothetical protein
MIGKIYHALMVLALTGCVAQPTIVHDPVEVKVPVAVACKIEPVPIPQWALDAIQPSADVYTKGRAVLAELEQRITYEGQLLAAIAACQ